MIESKRKEIHFCPVTLKSLVLKTRIYFILFYYFYKVLKTQELLIDNASVTHKPNLLLLTSFTNNINHKGHLFLHLKYD